jgi:hypothetical protein
MIDNRIDLETDKINLSKENIVQTIKDILSIYACDKYYDGSQYAQYSLDPSSVEFMRGFSMGPVTYIGYDYILRPFRDGLTDKEIKELPKKYMTFSVSVDKFIELYCDTFELDQDYSPIIKVIISKTLEIMKEYQ